MAGDDWKTLDQASMQNNAWLYEDAYFPALKDTNVTMRVGTRPVARGPFNFVAKNSGEILPVEITGVEIAPFKDLSDEVFQRDGKGGREQTFSEMRRFYPDLTPETPVTVLSYKPA